MSVTPLLHQPRLGSYAWKALRYFNGYRLFVPLLIGGLYLSSFAPNFLGTSNRFLFETVLVSYFLLTLSSIFLIQIKPPPFNYLVSILVSIDIASITLLMHASGGLNSGLGMLLAVSSASACLLLAHQMALGFAAFSSLAILFEQIYRQLQIPDSSVSFLQAGIMGATFFMTSFFSLILAQRAVAAEAKALERSQALEHLRKMNEKVIQHMKTGVLVVNHLQKIELFNQAAWKLLGMPENLQQAFLPQINTQLARELKQWLKHKNYRPTIIQSKSEALDLNVSFQFFSTDATIKDQVLIFLEDLSTLTQTAQHLKLSSLGRLTGSIAHEIRNPLGALSHAAQLLEESDSLCPEDKSLLKIILNHTERMNLMIENIMNLSQRKQAKTQSIQLDLLLLHFKNDFVLSRTPKPEIEVLINPPRISIQFDLTQFIQVVTNLCENAARFSYEKTQVPLVKMQAGIRYGSKQPFLDIIDQGQGVAVQDVEHIFEPFFTTSPKGSGLGLYLARELCEANGARLEYIPIPSGGACFRINFTENTEST